MAKRTIKITIKLPIGVTASQELEAKATKAANNAVAGALTDLVETQKLVRTLAAQGIQMTAEELMSRKVGRPARKSIAKKTGVRKRVVLSDSARNKMIEDLKEGMKIREAAKKYGVSGATVSSIKTKSGLTKKQS
jgi:Mor family transcriptional regulator